MPNDPSASISFSGASESAAKLAAAIEQTDCEYALGGALALGYSAPPRGTLDIDITLFIPLDQVEAVIDTLRAAGCEFDPASTRERINRDSFVDVKFNGYKVDVFLPLNDFYASAKKRRRRVLLEGQDVWVWDAETLTVFKLMFFRQKDLGDIENMMKDQGAKFDRPWVEREITTLFGARDPRVARWHELCELVP